MDLPDFLFPIFCKYFPKYFCFSKYFCNIWQLDSYWKGGPSPSAPHLIAWGIISPKCCDWTLHVSRWPPPRQGTQAPGCLSGEDRALRSPQGWVASAGLNFETSKRVRSCIWCFHLCRCNWLVAGCKCSMSWTLYVFHNTHRTFIFSVKVETWLVLLALWPGDYAVDWKTHCTFANTS